MKTNAVQLMAICCMLSFIVSCQKSIDEQISISEEPASTAFSLSGSLSTQPQERPFKGRIIGSFVNTATTNPAIYNGVANAAGNVTHLGAFNKVTSDVINILSSTVEGTFIMTSPGGEQLSGKYSGTFSFGTTPGTFSWVLNATITGGSGRFSLAKGEFVFLAEGTYSMTDGVVIGNYTETFAGMIIY